VTGAADRAHVPSGGRRLTRRVVELRVKRALDDVCQQIIESAMRAHA
jgi:hypothetical protein